MQENINEEVLQNAKNLINVFSNVYNIDAKNSKRADEAMANLTDA